MIRVNLLARTSGSPHRQWLPAEQRSAALGLVLLLATGLGIAGWWWELERERNVVDSAIVTAEADLTRLNAAARLVDQARSRKAELTERLALISRLRADQRGPVSLLETISRSVPDGLWLLELKQQGGVIQVEGRATSLTAITDFVERMQTSGLFQRPVEIVTTSMEATEDAPVVRFAVKAEAAGASMASTPAKSGATPPTGPGA